MEPNSNIYNDLQRQVEKKITLTTFPKFFQSKIYFDYSEQLLKRTAVLNNNYSIGSAYDGRGSYSKYYGSEIVSGRSTMVNLLSPCDSLGASCTNLEESVTMNSVLPTLHEDTELTMHNDVLTKSLGGSTSGSTQTKLTKEALYATQERRLEFCPPG